SAEISEALYFLKKFTPEELMHPKQKLLARILEAELRKNPNIRIIIFNQYRDSIKEIVNYINRLDGIKAKEFVGQASKETTKGMSQKEQIKRIEEFRKGKFNVLVASSVAEEGLDIPTVDLVIFYEAVPSEIRSIQRRGRTARAKAGRVIILITKGTRDEAFYWASKAKERRMLRTVKEIATKTSAEGKLKIEKQVTLSNYVNNEEIPVIYVDSRETNSLVVKELREKAKIVLKRLDVADYVISKDIAVERKTVADFLASIVDKRLFIQAKQLAESFEKPLLIVEGNFNELFYLRNIHRNAVIGALTSIALDYRIPIIFSKSPEESAEIIYAIAKREQLNKGKEIALRVGKKGFSLSEQQQFLVESLPLVGPSLAKKILKHFKTIENLARASKKELMQAEKLGKKKAEMIYEIFHKEYKGEDDKERV
ncbi:MAG: DEAD/DEAH box helicase, partial [Candidatus Diapherotrites archaeon]|nr:DEAD/DEAH box helicase [Candidatus Diapherotrites archaeon]